MQNPRWRLQKRNWKSSRRRLHRNWHRQAKRWIRDALDHPEKLEALTAFLKQMGQEEQAAGLTAEGLQQMYDIVHTRLPQIDTELANLEVEIAAAEAVSEEVDKQVKQATDNYEALEAGKIQAAAGTLCNVSGSSK